MSEFSAAVVRSAEALVAEARVHRDLEYPEIWRVQGEGGNYVVRVDPERPITWITCSCPHGRKKGAGAVRCKHGAAVLMTLGEMS